MDKDLQYSDRSNAIAARILRDRPLLVASMIEDHADHAAKSTLITFGNGGAVFEAARHELQQLETDRLAALFADLAYITGLQSRDYDPAYEVLSFLELHSDLADYDGRITWGQLVTVARGLLTKEGSDHAL